MDTVKMELKSREVFILEVFYAVMTGYYAFQQALRYPRYLRPQGGPKGTRCPRGPIPPSWPCAAGKAREGRLRWYTFSQCEPSAETHTQVIIRLH